MLIEHLGVVADQLFAGVGVEAATDGIDRLGDVLSGTVTRSLEQHVLNKVRQAAGFRGLDAGTRSHPNAQGDGTDVRHTLRNDADAIREFRALDATLL